MSSLNLPLTHCKLCSRELAAGALVCGMCHTLVHAEELQRISGEAAQHEQLEDAHGEAECWTRALALLPPDSSQAEWTRRRLAALATAPSASQPTAKKKVWARKLGPLAPIALALAKGKALLAIFNLKFLVSLFAFIWFYCVLYGARFGVGFAILILIHEMGHYIDVKRRGLPADMPIFLPGFGAYVRWKSLGVTKETVAEVSLAGPLAGWIAAAVCAMLWWKTGNGIWAALARASAWLNVLNLVPVWVLDGGQAADALDRTERFVLLTASVFLWLYLKEGIFFLVAAGAVWRLFTKDLPAQPSRATISYYVAVLAGLALVLRAISGSVPGRG